MTTAGLPTTTLRDPTSAWSTVLATWNIFAATRIQTAPQTALELVKYQNIICQLFTVYLKAAALKYDRLFQQAVARDKLHTLRWRRTSCPALFNHYAEKLNWIMAKNYGAPLLHYLDDFLLVGLPGKDTLTSEKLEGPTTTLTFLGIVLNTSAQQLYLPLDKLTRLSRSWLSTHKATKRELLLLIGQLSFAAKVVLAGRRFFYHLIDLSTTVRMLHHHVRLNAEAKADIRWVTSSHTYTSHSCGRNCLSLWLLLAHGVTAGGHQSHRDLNHRLQLLLTTALASFAATIYVTGVSPPQPVPEPQDPTGVCGCSLLPAPLTRAYTTAKLTLEMLDHMLQGISKFTVKNRSVTVGTTLPGETTAGPERTSTSSSSSGSNGGLQRMLSLFHSLNTLRDGRPLTPKSFHSTFLSLVDQCGYDAAKYNTHSLRIGAATAAARAGLPTDTFRRPSGMKLSCYIHAQLWLSPAPMMGWPNTTTSLSMGEGYIYSTCKSN
eukprot:Em0011g898a